MRTIIQVLVSPEVKQALKVRCAEQGESMSRFLNRLIAEALKGVKK